MSALAREIVTPEQRLEDWAMFHLSCAAKARARLQRMFCGTPDYGAENYLRHRACEEAGKHIATLRGIGCPLSPELRQAMAAEGLR